MDRVLKILEKIEKRDGAYRKDKVEKIKGLIKSLFDAGFTDEEILKYNTDKFERLLKISDNVVRDKPKEKNFFEEILWSTDSVVIFPSRDTNYYKIRIKNKEFIVTTDNLFNQIKFKKWYFENFKELIKLGKGDWDKLLVFWVEMAKEESFELSEEDEIVENIINNIKSSWLANNIDEVVGNTTRCYTDEDGNLLYSTESIKKILKRENSNITTRKLAVIINKYLKKGTEVRRIGNTTHRFWCFDMEKLQFIPKQLGEEDE